MVQDLISINAVAARLGLSVHQLRRWELMFGLDIKRGRGQQRQYRAEDMSVLERIKELVEQGWPTSQIRPQLEAEGLITPKLIGMPQTPGSQEVLMESVIGFRSFAERRFIDISKQIDELRQLIIAMTLKQELAGDMRSPWQPLREELVPPVKERPSQEIAIGPTSSPTDIGEPEDETPELQEITDQNYLTVLGKALDLVGWSDAEADEYSNDNFGIAVWIDLGRSHAEIFITHLRSLIAQKPAEEAHL